MAEPDRKPNHLLDESALEHQANGNPGDEEWETENWEIEPTGGDIVVSERFGDSVFGVVLYGNSDDSDTDGDASSGASGEEDDEELKVRVWWCFPWCRASRRDYVRKHRGSELRIVDRSLEMNGLVWHGEHGSGVVIRGQATVSVMSVTEVVNCLCHLDQGKRRGPHPDCLNRRDVNGSMLVCANPFRAHAFVTTKDLVDNNGIQSRVCGHVTGVVTSVLAQLIGHDVYFVVKNAHDEGRLLGHRWIRTEGHVDDEPDDPLHPLSCFDVIDQSLFDDVVWLKGSSDIVSRLANKSSRLRCVVVFSFVTEVIVKEFISGNLSSYAPCDLYPGETYVVDTLGSTGFVLLEKDVAALKEADAISASASEGLPPSSAQVRFSVPALFDWYCERGIVYRAQHPDEMDSTYWSERVQRLQSYAHTFAVVFGTVGQIDVLWGTGFIRFSQVPNLPRKSTIGRTSTISIPTPSSPRAMRTLRLFCLVCSRRKLGQHSPLRIQIRRAPCSTATLCIPTPQSLRSGNRYVRDGKRTTTLFVTLRLPTHQY